MISAEQEGESEHYPPELPFTLPLTSSLLWRYIDDILVFVSYLNNNRLSLKLTVVSEMASVPFLDLVLKGNVDTGKIETATYRKEVAGNTLLSANFYHPLHTLQAIPIGELVKS